MTSLTGITHRDSDILSGTPVFVGTRVSVRSLFDYLEGGDNLEEFLHQFPSVKREQAIAILEDYDDLRALRDAKEESKHQESIPLDKVILELGLN